MPRTTDPFDQFIYAEAFEGKTDSGNRFVKVVFTEDMHFKKGDTMWLNLNRSPRYVAMHRLPKEQYERLKEERNESQY